MALATVDCALVVADGARVLRDPADPAGLGGRVLAKGQRGATAAPTADAKVPQRRRWRSSPFFSAPAKERRENRPQEAQHRVVLDRRPRRGAR